MTDKLIPLRILSGTMADGRMLLEGTEIELPERTAKALLGIGKAEIRTDEETDTEQDAPEDTEGLKTQAAQQTAAKPKPQRASK